MMYILIVAKSWQFGDIFSHMWTHLYCRLNLDRSCMLCLIIWKCLCSSWNSSWNFNGWSKILIILDPSSCFYLVLFAVLQFRIRIGQIWLGRPSWSQRILFPRSCFSFAFWFIKYPNPNIRQLIAHSAILLVLVFFCSVADPFFAVLRIRIGDPVSFWPQIQTYILKA